MTDPTPQPAEQSDRERAEKLCNDHFYMGAGDRMRAALIAEFATIRREALLAAIEKLPEIMREEWNEWCADTGHFPDDFTWKGGNGSLWFEPGKWVSHIQRGLRNLIDGGA